MNIDGLNIQLSCEDVADMARRLAANGIRASLQHADPPWAFANKSVKGAAGNHYGGLSETQIARHLALSAQIRTNPGYLVMWITFAKLLDWYRLDIGPDTTPDQLAAMIREWPPQIIADSGWVAKTGWGWGKLRQLGVGRHVRGDLEIGLIFTYGKAAPANKDVSNLTLTSDDHTLDNWIEGLGNLYLTRRLGHSQKADPALQALLAMATKPGATVVDWYAGEFGAMALACLAYGNHYYGAEIDPARFARALNLIETMAPLISAMRAPNLLIH